MVKLTSNPFSSAYKELSNAANDYLTRREKMLSKIRSEIETIHDQSQVKIEIGEQVDIIVFWLRHSKIYVAEEEKLIFDRQAKENALLHVNRDFKWIFPVNPSRFEQLIADIIEYQQPDTTVRLVGRTNNPDGGRDIIIRRKEGENRKLTICQCKAYQNSVNKSHVTDIRDTLDYYEATGFLLAVTSDITAPLIDHLTSLEKKYDVDWWTRRELFKIMRQYPSLVNAYQDIIKVVDNKEGQS